MGCWSESCAISGMEIGDGDEMYMAYVVPHKYEKGTWVINKPPMRCTYGDYGNGFLIEDAPLVGLKVGDELSDRNEDNDQEGHEWGLPIYFKAEVFDFLPQLKPEFSFNDVKTLEDTYNAMRERGRKAVEERLTMFKEAAFKGTDDQDKVDELIKVYTSTTIIRELFGYGSDACMVDAADEYDRFINDPSLNEEDFWTAYRRAFILKCAYEELRKAMSPRIRGPQHSGEVALRQFYQHVLSIADAEYEKRKAEGYYDYD